MYGARPRFAPPAVLGQAQQAVAVVGVQLGGPWGAAIGGATGGAIGVGAVGAGAAAARVDGQAARRLREDGVID